MNYLIISEEGSYLPIAYKLKQEGHNVKFYVGDISKRQVGKGFVDTVSNIPKDTDITVVDMPLVSEVAKKLNGKIFSSCEFTDYFCSDKEYFEEICTLLELEYDIKAQPDNSIEGWFNGDRFVLPIFYHAYKRNLFGDDIGVYIPDGFMGVISDKEYGFSDLFKKTLKKLEKTLKRVGYKGVLRLELRGGKVCKPSFRFYVPTLFELIDISLSDLIKDTVNGNLRYIKTNREKALAVKISIPPFPYCPRYFWKEGLYHMAGMKLFKYDPEKLKHMWIQNVYKDNGVVKATGHSGDLGYVTSKMGSMSKEAGRRVKRTITNLSIPNIQYRGDLC